MMWRNVSQFHIVSECGQYELSGRYVEGRFAWRGRVVATDHLVQASADRDFVKLCCDQYAAKAEAEASA